MFDIFNTIILNEADTIDDAFDNMNSSISGNDTNQQQAVNTQSSDTNDSQNDNKYSIDDQLNNVNNNNDNQDDGNDTSNDEETPSDDYGEEPDADDGDNQDEDETPQNEELQEPEQEQDVPKLTILNLDSLNTKNNNIRIMSQFNELITKINECLEVIDNMTVKTNYQSEVINFVSNNLLDLKRDLNAFVLYKFDSSYEENVTKYVVYIKRFRLAMDIVRKVLDTNIKNRDVDL